MTEYQLLIYVYAICSTRCFLTWRFGVARRQQVHLSLLRRADDQLEEFLMIVDRVVDQREVCRTGFLRGIEDAAVRVDLEHVDRSIRGHAVITAGVAIAIHGFEQP